MDGLKITAACIERDELEKIVTKLGNLGLVEVDILDGKWILRDELEQLVLDYNALSLSSAIQVIEDKEWKLI